MVEYVCWVTMLKTGMARKPSSQVKALWSAPLCINMYVEWSGSQTHDWKLVRDRSLKYSIAQGCPRTCHNSCRCSRQWLGRRGWTACVQRSLDAGMDQGSLNLICDVLVPPHAKLEGILQSGNLALQSLVKQSETRKRMLHCVMSRS